MTWINEDAFDFLTGEMTGQHDVATTAGPESFALPLLKHAEKGSFTFKQPGEYEYLCTIHPYMKGKVRVVKSP